MSTGKEDTSRLTIGRLAKQAGVNLETVRYYERRGLMPEPPRTASGYRIYSKDDVARIRFIKHAQELGFTLKEISELLSLRVSHDVSCAEVKNKAREKIEEIDKKIESLQEMKKVLIMLENRCTGTGPTSQCPILAGIDGSKVFGFQQ